MAGFFLLLCVLTPWIVVGSNGCGPDGLTDMRNTYCGLSPSGKEGVCSQLCCDPTTHPEMEKIHAGPLWDNVMAQSTDEGCPLKCAGKGPGWACKLDAGGENSRRRRVNCEWFSKGGTSFCYCMKCPLANLDSEMLTNQMLNLSLKLSHEKSLEQKWAYSQITDGATGEGDGHTQAVLVGGTISCFFLMAMVVFVYFRVSKYKRKVSDQQHLIVRSEVEF